MGVKGDSTGMAGEFYAMYMLYRNGHRPALTLGKAKSVDIYSDSPKGRRFGISVKANCGGGKWPIGSTSYADLSDFVFICILFENKNGTPPRVWIIPADKAEAIKRPWQSGHALYLYREDQERMAEYENAWHYLDIDTPLY